MSPGVVSLRCPSCGRPFLSLPQQQAEALVTCPHCAQSAPISAFGPASSPPKGAAALPLRRRVIQQPATPAPTQPVPSAFLGGSLPWPPAPEQPPAFRPPAAPATFSPPFPPAPPAPPQWQASSLNGAPPSLFPATAPPPSPFGVIEPVPQPLPQSPPPPARNWQPTGVVPEPFGIEEPDDQLQAYQPHREERNVPLGIFFLLVMSFAGWLLWDNLQSPINIQVPVVTKPAPATAPAPAVVPPVAPKEAEKPQSPPPTTVPRPAPVAPAPPEPEVRRAEPVTPLRPTAPKKQEVPTADLSAASAAAPKMLQALFHSHSAAERATLVADADDYRDDLAAFFSRPLPVIKSVIPAGQTPHLLPGQAVVPLFQVMTSTNAHGALLRLIPQPDGHFLLDWPLFAETHERRLSKFLESKPTEPAWFHVGLRRSHGLEISAEVRDRHFAFDLQGSADASVRAIGIVQKESPLGRYLDREAEWGAVYVGRLLLQFRPLPDGSHAAVILDCEGATTGASESR